MMPVMRCWREANARPLARQHARVLQIALAPAPVARRQIDQRRRAFLVRAAERRQHVDRPAGAAHQRRLDEVVAEDVAAERRLARQVGHAAMVGEGAGADDRVVAPIVAVAPHPRREAGGEHRAGMRAANCCRRAKKVLRLTMSGRLWMIPASGSSSIASASLTIVSPVIKLSASSTSMCG